MGKQIAAGCDVGVESDSNVGNQGQVGTAGRRNRRTHQDGATLRTGGGTPRKNLHAGACVEQILYAGVGDLGRVATGGQCTTADADVGIAAGRNDFNVIRVKQPFTGLAHGRCRRARDTLRDEQTARGFDLSTITALGAAFGIDGPAGSGYRVGARHITPQHHRAALARVGGAGVDGGALFHGHPRGLVQGMGVSQDTALGTGATLPVATHQHLAAACGARGGDAAARLQGNVVARKDDAPTHAGHAAGIDAATVAHDTALQLACGHGRQNHQPAFGLNCLPVVHQRLPLAGFNPNVGELVVGVQLQLHHLARGQRHGAFAGHDQALVAHFGRDEGDVAL